MRSRYSIQGKIMQPISSQEFEAAVKKLKPRYAAYLVLIYYTGIRVSEALRMVKEDFRLEGDILYVDVGTRLKHGKHTEPLPLNNLELPFLEVLIHRVKRTRKGMRVFTFNRTTATRQIRQAGLGYSHHCRLTAITEFLKAGYSVAQIVNWFGISVQTVNSYIGTVDLQKMGSMKR